MARDESDVERHTADVDREYPPLDDVDGVFGVAYDGERVWCATGEALCAVDPETGDPHRSIDVPADAGTAFDGTHLYQLGGELIRKIDPDSGQVVATIPAPPGGGSGMAWAEGSLWVGQYREGRIVRLDPSTGEVLARLESKRLVTGVAWVDGELWHGSVEGDDVELRRVDPATGQVHERLGVQDGMVTGLSADGRGGFYCGGGDTACLRVVQRRAD
jgi:glutamine cyclotransferase